MPAGPAVQPPERDSRSRREREISLSLRDARVSLSRASLRATGERKGERRPSDYSETGRRAAALAVAAREEAALVAAASVVLQTVRVDLPPSRTRRERVRFLLVTPGTFFRSDLDVYLRVPTHSSKVSCGVSEKKKTLHRTLEEPRPLSLHNPLLPQPQRKESSIDTVALETLESTRKAPPSIERCASSASSSQSLTCSVAAYTGTTISFVSYLSASRRCVARVSNALSNAVENTISQNKPE